MDPLPNRTTYDPIHESYRRRKERGVRKFFHGSDHRISPDAVTSIEIEPTCLGSYWKCKHNVKVVLDDGSEKEGRLNNYEIIALIHNIEESCIHNPVGLGHFELDPNLVLGNFFHRKETHDEPNTDKDKTSEVFKMYFG